MSTVDVGVVRLEAIGSAVAAALIQVGHSPVLASRTPLHQGSGSRAVGLLDVRPTEDGPLGPPAGRPS